MHYSNNKTYAIASVIGFVFVVVAGLISVSSAEACTTSRCGTYYPPVYYPPTTTYTSPLQISCYPQPLTINAGDSATWVSNVFGGTGSFSYSWSGTDGLSGAGPSLSKVYYTSGAKSATLTVTSGNQTQTASCSGSVTVYGNNNNNYYPYTPPPVYYPPTYYSPLQVSCSPNTTYTNGGNAVTWSATVSGGYNSGYYSNPTFSWSGTDGLYGYGQSVAMTYNTPGYKTASVTATANGQTVSQSCSSAVNVSGYAYNNYNYNNNYTYGTTYVNTNNSGLDVGCYADPSTASPNQPVTWTVEVTGGAAPYTYSWSGTDSLTGAAASLIKYYSSTGEKNAVVSVTSADGKTSTRACSNTVTVRRTGSANTGATVTPAAPVKVQTDTNSSNNSQSAAALFSLQNVPWGWVAILIILILFATIMYLIFNRPKI